MLNRDVNAAMIMAITRFTGASDKLRIEWMTQGQRTPSLWLTDLPQRKACFIIVETSSLCKTNKKTAIALEYLHDAFICAFPRGQSLTGLGF